MKLDLLVATLKNFIPFKQVCFPKRKNALKSIENQESDICLMVGKNTENLERNRTNAMFVCETLFELRL